MKFRYYFSFRTIFAESVFFSLILFGLLIRQLSTFSTFLHIVVFVVVAVIKKNSGYYDVLCFFHFFFITLYFKLLDNFPFTFCHSCVCVCVHVHVHMINMNLTPLFTVSSFRFDFFLFSCLILLFFFSLGAKWNISQPISMRFNILCAFLFFSQSLCLPSMPLTFWMLYSHAIRPHSIECDMCVCCVYMCICMSVSLCEYEWSMSCRMLCSMPWNKFVIFYLCILLWMLLSLLLFHFL